MKPRGDHAKARTCILTPEGRGAICVVGIWGPGALEVADAVFRPRHGDSLALTRVGRPRLGRIGDGLGDEVVAVVTRAEPPQVEVHCHGGPAASALVVNALMTAGAERRQPVAWVRHTSRSLVAAEAEVDIMRATTVRTAEILLDQAQGSLEAETRQLLARLPFDPATVLQGIQTLIHRSAVGLRLVKGWKVVLAGRPNVGKSRLLNALAGYDRSIVDPTPGTTRDIVTIRTAFDGWPVELADTAGIRFSDDAIEAAGIASSRRRLEHADLVLLVLDRSTALTRPDRDLLEAEGHALVVANKADLTPAWRPSTGYLTVSAERGDGIEALCREIARRLVPDAASPGSAVPFRQAQVRRLEEAAQAIREGLPKLARARLERLLAALPRSFGRDARGAAEPPAAD